MCIERVQQLVLNESEYNSFHFGELYASRLFASTPIEKERWMANFRCLFIIRTEFEGAQKKSTGMKRSKLQTEYSQTIDIKIALKAHIKCS